MTSPSRRPPSVLRSFLDSEASAGYLLIVAAALALLVANSPAAPTYFATLKIEIGGDVGPVHLRESLLHWINDGLMAIFFLLVGLEIKREVLDGQLRGLSRIALPGLAAAGGMVVPALLYVAANLGHAPGLRGWAIPSATDIAFALGILALAGPRPVPGSSDNDGCRSGGNESAHGSSTQRRAGRLPAALRLSRLSGRTGSARRDQARGLRPARRRRPRPARRT